ncbi:hypothetical protein [Haloarcula laminariae]|uniref:hypothetical protein n=1 Tax=Haloarcula laminariae TaxID=2961577 RepID=UPI0021C66E97|nr:hypothetical protein [Halomicroarcula laminariae]
MPDLELVAFDIETTGFDVEDEVTVIGLEFDLGSRVAYQTGGRPVEEIQAEIREKCDHQVTVEGHDNEEVMLRGMSAYIRHRLMKEDVLLVAYNGETWQGGFDVPFLRTRFAIHDIPWPFIDIPYADLLPIVKKLFNTTSGGESNNDLPTAHELLCTNVVQAAPADPFEDSSEAVTAFEEGRYEELVQHNVADIVRTRQLGRVAQWYCSKSDFSLKSMTPVDAVDSRE